MTDPRDKHIFSARVRGEGRRGRAKFGRRWVRPPRVAAGPGPLQEITQPVRLRCGPRIPEPATRIAMGRHRREKRFVAMLLHASTLSVATTQRAPQTCLISTALLHWSGYCLVRFGLLCLRPLHPAAFVFLRTRSREWRVAHSRAPAPGCTEISWFLHP